MLSSLPRKRETDTHKPCHSHSLFHFKNFKKKNKQQNGKETRCTKTDTPSFLSHSFSLSPSHTHTHTNTYHSHTSLSIKCFLLVYTCWHFQGHRARFLLCVSSLFVPTRGGRKTSIDKGAKERRISVLLSFPSLSLSLSSSSFCLQDCLNLNIRGLTLGYFVSYLSLKEWACVCVCFVIHYTTLRFFSLPSAPPSLLLHFLLSSCVFLKTTLIFPFANP